jgi:hypothetical protein
MIGAEDAGDLAVILENVIPPLVRGILPFAAAPEQSLHLSLPVPPRRLRRRGEMVNGLRGVCVIAQNGNIPPDKPGAFSNANAT